jgi:uncharacterized protein
LEFEWDPAKAKTNVQKHGVTLPDALTVFDDPAARLRWDEAHESSTEIRGKIVGFSKRNHLLAGIFTERHETIRIISAWRASATEEATYAEALR